MCNRQISIYLMSYVAIIGLLNMMLHHRHDPKDVPSSEVSRTHHDEAPVTIDTAAEKKLLAKLDLFFVPIIMLVYLCFFS